MELIARLDRASRAMGGPPAGELLVELPLQVWQDVGGSKLSPPAMVRATLELLAGIPTIVYGYIALMLVTPVLRQIFEPLGLRVETYNALSACIVVGILYSLRFESRSS